MDVKKTIDVIIPVYKPDVRLGQLMDRLHRQTRLPGKIIIMNTQKEYWDPEYISHYTDVEVHHISKREFDHGGTRAAAAALSHADIMVFMTQDALPGDAHLLEYLAEGLQKPEVKAAYARQLPAEDCHILERYTRSFNYPDKSRVKSREDLSSLGIKTFFCSNVCAAYDKAAYDKLGGFPGRTIFNEDMIYASKVIREGYRVAYCSRACVIHSHNYNCGQQFHRNFDLGVSHAEFPEVFEGISAEGEGMKLVKDTAGYALSIRRPNLLFYLFVQSAAKYAGYFLGKRYKHLPLWLVKKCSMNKDYWTTAL